MERPNRYDEKKQYSGIRRQLSNTVRKLRPPMMVVALFGGVILLGAYTAPKENGTTEISSAGLHAGDLYVAKADRLYVASVRLPVLSVTKIDIIIQQ